MILKMLFNHLSCIQFFVNPCYSHSMPVSSVLHYLPNLHKFMSIESVILSNHFILCQVVFFLHQGLFQWVSSLHKVAKVLELHHQQQSFQWTFRLISFRIDWFDLLAVQEALKSFRQHYSFKQSILQCSAFFMVQLSHPYMTTG